MRLRTIRWCSICFGGDGLPVSLYGSKRGWNSILAKPRYQFWAALASMSGVSNQFLFVNCTEISKLALQLRHQHPRQVFRTNIFSSNLEWRIRRRDDIR